MATKLHFGSIDYIWHLSVGGDGGVIHAEMLISLNYQNYSLCHGIIISDTKYNLCILSAHLF